MQIIPSSHNLPFKNFYRSVSDTFRAWRQLVSAQVFGKRQKILGRVACLGSDLYSLRFQRKLGFRLVNQQKVRVDLWLEWLEGNGRPRAELVKNLMSRPDVYPLIENQVALPWLAENDFEFLLMDSFSELTDQKFTHKKEGWSFCCHYSDINHNPEFDLDFECVGLLPIEEIEATYTRFFEWFESRHPHKKVVFVLFPTELDDRLLYKERGAEILRVMTKLQQEKRFIQNLIIDDSLVDWNENDRFPYHFAKATNLAFIEAWDRLNNSDNT